ncbi:MAG: PEP/pyruvate-binding domain-containing protein [Methylococcales bacterium]|nr:PEP/pyruvate-binding domain-containing protein [Methylococcales bacterium]
MKRLQTLSLTLLLASVSTSSFALNCPADKATYSIQTGKLDLPRVYIEQDNVLFQSQLNLLAVDNPFHFQLGHLQRVNDVVNTGEVTYQPITQQVTLPSLCISSSEGDQLIYNVEMQQIPAVKPMQFLLKTAKDITGKSIFNWPLANNKAALFLTDRTAFENLATTSNVSGVLGVRELKFIITDIDTDHPVLFFINSEINPLHYDFLRNVLNHYQPFGYNTGNTQFIAETYFKDDRHHLAGSVVAYDHYTETGLYALEFWPTDPVSAPLIEKAYQTITAAMPFLTTPLAYHPVGNTHELNYSGMAEAFDKKNIRSIATEELFAQLDSAILNKGEAYGRLKIVNAGDRNPNETDIAIYSFIPNDLGHVGGIITEAPQTPLSHINLKARQNNTPNAYMKNVRTDPEISPLINQWVHYTVSDAGVELTLASEEKSLQWLADKIPDTVTIPKSDLTVTEPQALANLHHRDWVRVGVKAANVAELDKILVDGVAPKGYALPFAMYDEFMRLPRCVDDLTQLCNDSTSLSLYQFIQQLDLENKPDNKIQLLTELRATIEQAEAPQTLIDRIESVRLFWQPAGEPFTQKLRVRSSTNNEDLEGFNGAGLYDSVTHKPKEGKLINSVKQVWASLWTERAFDERRLHRIEHFKTYMGVLIHPNYGDEHVNGVAITKNIYNPSWEGFYVNAQYGELSITNPEPIETDKGLITPIPDEFVMTRLAASINDYAWETQFIRHSNVETIYDAPVPTENVLTEVEMNLLRDNLRIIHAHFKALYQGDDNFAIDIEFKITETGDGSRGKLAIKQARPWVD